MLATIVTAHYSQLYQDIPTAARILDLTILEDDPTRTSPSLRRQDCTGTLWRRPSTPFDPTGGSPPTGPSTPTTPCTI